MLHWTICRLNICAVTGRRIIRLAIITVLRGNLRKKMVRRSVYKWNGGLMTSLSPNLGGSGDTLISK